MTEKSEINIGDSFIKPEDPRTVWVVEQFVDLPGLPRHAELKAKGYRNRKVLVAVSALMDRIFYRRVENHR